MRIVKNYEINYSNLPFENILRIYRKKNIIKYLLKHSHQRILEIGCGHEPLFNEINNFKRFVIVEPSTIFCKKVKSEAKSNPKVRIINDYIENCYNDLVDEKFDFIIIGGFIHEISNPKKVLAAVRTLCVKNTIVYNYAPNAMSIHRLLAKEMGLIESIYLKSKQDKLFERQKVFDQDSFNELMNINGFKILDSGSYFIKLFSNDQMADLLSKKIIDDSLVDGLDKMIKYMPSLGAELFNICRKND